MLSGPNQPNILLWRSARASRAPHTCIAHCTGTQIHPHLRNHDQPGVDVHMGEAIRQGCLNVRSSAVLEPEREEPQDVLQVAPHCLTHVLRFGGSLAELNAPEEPNDCRSNEPLGSGRIKLAVESHCLSGVGTEWACVGISALTKGFLAFPAWHSFPCIPSLPRTSTLNRAQWCQTLPKSGANSVDAFKFAITDAMELTLKFSVSARLHRPSFRWILEDRTMWSGSSRVTPARMLWEALSSCANSCTPRKASWRTPVAQRCLYQANRTSGSLF